MPVTAPRERQFRSDRDTSSINRVYFSCSLFYKKYFSLVISLLYLNCVWFQMDVISQLALTIISSICLL